MSCSTVASEVVGDDRAGWLGGLGESRGSVPSQRPHHSSLPERGMSFTTVLREDAVTYQLWEKNK